MSAVTEKRMKSKGANNPMSIMSSLPKYAVVAGGLGAFQNLSSKFNAALGVPPQGFCELPRDDDPQGSVQR